MINRVNTIEPVPEIIAVLHKHAIPLALIPQVFDNVQQEIRVHTIPYCWISPAYPAIRI